jgi:S-DNA-T family DNA segregation ATPase FtsK/SpoIIIE
MFMRKPLALCAAALVVLVGARPARSGPVPGAGAIPDSGTPREAPDARFDPALPVRELLHFATHVVPHSGTTTVSEGAPPAWMAEPANLSPRAGMTFAGSRADGAFTGELPVAAFQCPRAASNLSEMQSLARATGEFGAGSRAVAGCSRITGGAGAFASEAGAAGATLSRGSVVITEALGGLGKAGAAGAAGAAAAAAAAAAKKRKE